MGATEHPAYAKLAAVGHEITTLVKPKAIVVISGHWQDDSLNDKSRAKINVAEEADLIYDFYGFPRRYYEYEFPNRGSPEVAERVAGLLREGGVEVEGVERGLDHGIWAGFIVGESMSTNCICCASALLNAFVLAVFASRVVANELTARTSLRSEKEPTKCTYRASLAPQHRRPRAALPYGPGARKSA